MLLKRRKKKRTPTMSLKPFWLHCNFCYDMKASSYRITNCGKVFCPAPACLQAVTRPDCRACRGPCRHIPLDDSAPPEVKNLFKGVSARVKRLVNSLDGLT